MQMKATEVFSFIGFVQVVSSVVYLILTYRYDTPLKNSLNEEQLKIRLESVRKRRRAFYYGVAIAIALFLVVKHQKLM